MSTMPWMISYLKELHNPVQQAVDDLKTGRLVVEDGGEMALIAGPHLRTKVLKPQFFPSYHLKTNN